MSEKISFAECLDKQYFCRKWEVDDKIDRLKLKKQIVEKINKKIPLNSDEENCVISLIAEEVFSIIDNGINSEISAKNEGFYQKYEQIAENYLSAESILLNSLDDYKKEHGNRFLDYNLFPIIHQKLLSDEMQKNPGFRNIEIDNSEFENSEPAPAGEVISEVGNLFTKYVHADNDWYDLNKDRPVNFADIAKAHAQFVRVRPFCDGNKLMAFVLTNGMLKLQGLLPISICKTQYEYDEYLAALKLAIETYDVTALAKFFVKCELKAQRNFITSKAFSLNDIAKKDQILNFNSKNDPIIH